jgi:carbonic anhydrase
MASSQRRPEPAEETPDSLLDDLVERNRRYARESFGGLLPLRPRRKLAVVACMDSRMPVFSILGLAPGEAHIVRNAGGVITDDVIRSLVLSQRLMGTESIVLIPHTASGLTKISEDDLRATLETETGMRPSFAFEAFRDPYDNVRQSMRRLRLSPFLLHRDRIRGFVYDVANGLLEEVRLEDRPDAATRS